MQNTTENIGEILKQKIKYDGFESNKNALPQHFNIAIDAYYNIDGTDYSLLCTNGLSQYKMEMPEGLENKSNVELLLLLPEKVDENFNYHGLNCKLLFEKLTSIIIEKKSWIGAGHTFPNIINEPTISIYTEMDHFLLIEPIVLKEEFSEIKINNEEITFLAVIPLFKKELDYKMKNGAYSLLRRLKKNAVTELFVMKRPMVLKRKFFGL